MIVFDAAAVVDLLLDRGGASKVRDQMASEGVLHAPHLLDTEVLHAVRRWVLHGKLSEERAAKAVEDLADLPIVFYPHSPLRARVWSLRDRLSAYDGTYVALAEALGATLLTADGRLARAADSLVETIDI
ncbi:MAG: type II toxin-antitoxin system VapC family toxin [Solirubrobacterales bacterium]